MSRKVKMKAAIGGVVVILVGARQVRLLCSHGVVMLESPILLVVFVDLVVYVGVETGTTSGLGAHCVRQRQRTPPQLAAFKVLHPFRSPTSPQLYLLSEVLTKISEGYSNMTTFDVELGEDISTLFLQQRVILPLFPIPYPAL